MKVWPGTELVTLTPKEMVVAASRALARTEALLGSISTLRRTPLSTFHGHFLGAVGEEALAKVAGLTIPEEPGEPIPTRLGLIDVCSTAHDGWMYSRAPDLLQPAGETLKADLYFLAETDLPVREVVLHGAASRDHVQTSPVKPPRWDGASAYYQVKITTSWSDLRPTLLPVLV